MSRAIFVTGTDTGVGKTVITRALARSAARRGVDIAVLKPVESGVVPEVSTDAEKLIAAARRNDPSDDICAYAFKTPVSPHLAAAIEHRKIDPSRVASFLKRWTERTDLVLAEGAGGLLVPLADGVTYGEVIAQSGYRLIIVAPNRLGAVNAALLTLEASRSRKIDVIGVVFNGTPEGDFGNADAVAAFGQVSILGEFPTAKEDDDDLLADLAEAHLDLKKIFFTLR